MGNNNYVDEFNKKFGEESMYTEIARYLVKLFSGLKFEDAKEIAVILYNQNFLDIDRIKSGNYDREITDVVRLYLCRNKSVRDSNEENVKVRLESRRRSSHNKDIIKTSVATILVGGMLATGVYTIVQPKEPTENLGSSLGKLVTSPGSEDYEKGKNIVNQRTYEVGRDNNGQPIFAYDQRGIAEDIIKICRSNHILFDVVLNEVYKELNRNRLENMDLIFSYLKIELGKDDSLVDIYERVEDCDIFLDYIDELGYIQKDEEYDAFEAYDELKSKVSEFGTIFQNLSEKDQKALENLMKKYINDERFKEFTDIIRGMLESQNQEYENGSPKLGG